MILIADSGSTKTSWCFSENNALPRFFSTSGINPFFRTTEDIEEELRNKLLLEIHSVVHQIYFYGAGIINQEKGSVVKLALQKLFPQATIEVQSDLLAAARATLGNEKGIACILGTGSNSCFYNGTEIIEHVPPLGFILGDEGSGAVLGRKLAGDFLKGIMPETIAERFKNKFSIEYSGFLEGVYKKEKPNQFLAQFVPFLNENITEKYCIELVENSFHEFVNRNIKRYYNFEKQQVSFVGSVAFYFKAQLQKVFEQSHLHLKTVIKEPLNGLLEFHKKN